LSQPRLDVDLAAIAHNARELVDRLAPKGIRVTGVAKATLGSPGVAAAMLSGGVTGIGDSRVENLTRLRSAGIAAPMTLIRSPMLSQVELVVQQADLSLNTEPVLLAALSAAAVARGTRHGVVLMVELGDLREGVAAGEVVDLARLSARLPGLRLAGLGTNLACQNGIAPDQAKMDQLSDLAEQVEGACGRPLSVVSGGNSANLDWALATEDVGRVDELRLGEAILLGTEPLHRRAVSGLRTDAFTLTAEVIELQSKPAQPWGTPAQSAFGDVAPRLGTGRVRQAILALGRQDTDPDSIHLPPGMTVLGMSSDHLVVDIGDHQMAVGDELVIRLGYGALLRAMTSPYVVKIETSGGALRLPPLRGGNKVGGPEGASSCRVVS
jgi:predicted amino acid racemase